MPKKLLVADKSVTIQKVVGITFAQEDFSVSYVGDGEDALNKTKQLKPDLLLIHTLTPRLSGYDVCSALKKDPVTQNIPILLMAGIHEQFDENKVKSCGADGHIMKPFETQALIDKVKELTSGAPKAAAPKPSATPPAAPKSQPATGSTISGQAPYSPPSSATIAGQAPIGSDEPNFDFALDDSFTADSPPASAKGSAPAKPTPPDPPSTPDMWDFGGDSPAVAPGADIVAEPEAPAVEWAEPAISESPAKEAPSEEAPAFEFASGENVDFGAEGSEEPTINVQSDKATSNVNEFDFSGETETGDSIPLEPAASFLSPTPTSAPKEASHPSQNSNGTFTDEQVEAIVTKVFKQVIERIAWEVVPELAESIIKEELKRLTQEK